MTHLLKHYWKNRDTNQWSLNSNNGITTPGIPGLEIFYNLTDENGITFSLSKCPDTFLTTSKLSSEDLDELKSNPEVVVISESLDSEEENIYEVEYYFIQPSGEGLWIITQDQWDQELLDYDARQETKRYDFLRGLRDQILAVTDWLVIKSKEQGSNLSAGFKSWRQGLRDLPESSTFPTSFPDLCPEVENDSKVLELYSQFNRVRDISMINDPLSPLPGVQESVITPNP